jgi:hypothetical protein
LTTLEESTKVLGNNQISEVVPALISKDDYFYFEMGKSFQFTSGFVALIASLANLTYMGNLAYLW